MQALGSGCSEEKNQIRLFNFEPFGEQVTVTNKMKKLFIIIAMMLIGTFSYSQGVCVNRVSTYDGPKTTDELSYLLANSEEAIIQNLSDGTKQSLVTYMVFDNGLPKGMSEIDENIETLYGSSDVEQVFSAILSMPVTICTYDTKPAVQDMSYDDYMRNFQNDPGAWVGASVGSLCTNCLIVPATCCALNGPGCVDNYYLTANGYSLHIY